MQQQTHNNFNAIMSCEPCIILHILCDEYYILTCKSSLRESNSFSPKRILSKIIINY